MVRVVGQAFGIHGGVILVWLHMWVEDEGSSGKEVYAALLS